MNPKRTTISWLLVAAFAAVLGYQATASAHAGGPHGWIYIGGDKVYNYDHRSQSATDTNIDWPIHIIFHNNATVNKVKGTDGSHDLDNDIFKALGGSKYLRLSDAWPTTFVWDSDKGRKKFNCVSNSNAWTEHFRVYADSDDRFWTSAYGYYVVATTHWDFDDPEIWGTSCDDAKFGWDELAADNLIFYFSSHSSGPGWSTWVSDAHNGYNAQDHDDYVNGNLHRRTSDGYLHTIHVP